MSVTDYNKQRTYGPALWLQVVLLSLCLTPANAHDYVLGDIKILHPYASPTPPGATIAAGYLTVDKTGDGTDRLLGGTASFADRIEIHQSTIENDVAKMRMLSNGLEITTANTVELTPGETHLMFVGLKHPLKAGMRYAATLLFEKAGSIDIEFVAERPNHEGKMTEEMDHSTMDHSTTKQ